MPCGIIYLIRDTQQLLTLEQLCLTVSVTQDPVVSDLHEPIGQDVQEEASNELRDIQAHQLDGIIILAVSISEAHVISFHRGQPLIGERHPVGVSTQVLDNRFSTCEWGLAVHHPLLVIEVSQ